MGRFGGRHGEECTVCHSNRHVGVPAGIAERQELFGVGHATTSAMVTAILLIVIWDAISTLIFNQLGI